MTPMVTQPPFSPAGDESSKLVQQSIERLRRKLLDLSLKNRLINFKHSEKSRTHIRIVEERLEEFFDRLEDGRTFGFRWVDQPERELPDENSVEFRESLRKARETDSEYINQKEKLSKYRSSRQIARIERDLKDRVRTQMGLPPRKELAISERAIQLGMNPSFDLEEAAKGSQETRRQPTVQVLHYREEMDTKLAGIHDGAQTLEKDAGINALYCAFGFVEWYEADFSEGALFAPLLFYPVDLEKHLVDHEYVYHLKSRDADVEVNATLAEILLQNYSLQLPLWENDETIPSYFRKVRRVISKLDRWKLRDWLTVGLFTFSKLVMYQDLDRKNWPGARALEKHGVLRDIFTGADAIASSTLAPDYDVDAHKPEQHEVLTVMNADSSQHSAIIDVLNGKNLVIQGPPGTGKSQTITNLIASALHAGKIVLFVAEKMAALEVVKKRLDEAGLGQFCLELHSSKTRKVAVLDSIRKRLNFDDPELNPNKLNRTIQDWERARRGLLYYVEQMKKPAGNTDLKTYEILRGCCVRAERAKNFPAALKQTRIQDPLELDTFKRNELLSLARDLDARAGKVNLWNGLRHHPWRGFQNDTIGQFGLEELLVTLRGWRESARRLDECLLSVEERTACVIEHSVAGAEGFVRDMSTLPQIPEEFDEDLFRRVETPALSSALVSLASKVRELEKEYEEIDTMAAYRKEILLVGSDAVGANICVVSELGFDSQTLEQVKSSCRELEAKSALLVRVLPIADQLAGRFGISRATISDLLLISRAADLLQGLTRNQLRFRHADVVDEASLKPLEAAASLAESLQRSNAHLREQFEFSLLPELDEIRRAARIIASAGPLHAFFSSDYRRSRKLFRSMAIGPRPSRIECVRRLTELVKYLEGRRTLETNEGFRRAAGPYFQGMDTPWGDLLAVCRWAHVVRNNLLPEREQAQTIQDVVLHGDVSKVEIMATLPRSTDFPGLSKALSICGDEGDEFLSVVTSNACQKSDRSRALVEQFSRWGLAPETNMGDLPRLFGAVKRSESLRTELSSEISISLLGPHPDAWIEKSTYLFKTSRFAKDLAGIGFSDLAWRRIANGPVASRLLAISEGAEQVAENVGDIQSLEKTASFLGELDSTLWVGQPDFASASLELISQRISYALEHEQALPLYVDFLRLENHAASTPLSAAMKIYAESGQEYVGLAEALEFVFYRSAAEVILSNDSELKSHSGESHERLRAQFRNQDIEIQRLRRKQIAAELLQSEAPQGVGKGLASQFTELSLLQRQLGLQKRHIPLRDLFRRAGRAVQALKPCFLMSPMSVAQFLDPNVLRFDLLVMDEASQIRPEDSMGAIARGAQLVVVGDPQQLPPTSFFERVDSDGSQDENEDVESMEDLTGQESILDLACSAYQPVRVLRWHYRSQHEQLIAFSNKEFYDGSLIIFPSPRGGDPDFGVKLDQIGGVYDQGENRAEAEAVVAATRDFIQKNAERSLGIAAINQKQRDRIYGMIEEAARQDPDLQAYFQRWSETLEPFFVKNLENVQGDERDVIFISTVYGRDAAGNFYQRFGPINSKHGYRRLNVLFTRAKQQVRIFTSMDPSMFKIEDTSPRGVRALKNYLQFARDGHLDFAGPSGGSPDSEFETWVMERLRRNGYEVVPQLGVAGYFIDLAVRHPDRNGLFILGIECDGATYHSARSVRDRDRLRQENLVNLGWKIYRIWSTDWFQNPENEFNKLRQTIEDLRSGPTV
jgi:very-short-patch-repair endonuclease